MHFWSYNKFLIQTSSKWQPFLSNTVSQSCHHLSYHVSSQLQRPNVKAVVCVCLILTHTLIPDLPLKGTFCCLLVKNVVLHSDFMCMVPGNDKPQFICPPFIDHCYTSKSVDFLGRYTWLHWPVKMVMIVEGIERLNSKVFLSQSHYPHL